jgi:hypothetical protein
LSANCESRRNEKNGLLKKYSLGIHHLQQNTNFHTKQNHLREELIIQQKKYTKWQQREE